MKKIFENILQNKDSFLRSKTGNDFEDRFEEYLRHDGYIRLDKTDYKDLLSSIKKSILNKKSDTYIKMSEINGVCKSYFRLPYGSQEYPDFIVLTNNYIVPVEIKYSTNDGAKPMWNSNLPKRNGIYIFGSHDRKDITFFAGRLVISETERDDLLDLFENLHNIMEDYKKNTKAKIDDDFTYSMGRGFVPYLRVTFDQSKEYGKEVDINYFTSHNRKYVEGETLKILAGLE